MYYGSEGLGLHATSLSVHVAIATWEWGAYLGAENLERGIRVRTSSFSRHHINAAMGKAKANGQYINSNPRPLRGAERRVRRGAAARPPRATSRRAAEENFFMLRNNVIYTPALTSALPGITRDTVITLAKDLGYSVQERLITRDEVYIADECFFTGTAAEVTPIREVDGRKHRQREPRAGNRSPAVDLLRPRARPQEFPSRVADLRLMGGRRPVSAGPPTRLLPKRRFQIPGHRYRLRAGEETLVVDSNGRPTGSGGAQRREPLSGDAGRSPAQLSDARHVPLELAPQGVSPHRGTRRSDVPLLRSDLCS